MDWKSLDPRRAGPFVVGAFAGFNRRNRLPMRVDF